MKSKATKRFWALYDALPNDVKRQATKAYLLWQKNPNAHGLRFKRVGKQMPVYSVRIGGGYRALGLWKGDTMTWFWIGKHDEYERILRGM
ncbi:MAG: hypothetical protein GXP42_05805 [Chloroflexi bacterium]|nr:hypothetical protein [Chloroflexota bacterium]